MTICSFFPVNIGTSELAKWITQVIYRCDHCGRISIATAPAYLGGNDLPGIDRQVSDANTSVKWIPRIGVSPEFMDVPPHIASAASEAHECASIGANRAAILMARTVIEASAKFHEITTGTLHEKIQKLEDKGVIRPLILKAAMGVKDFGNDMAHGDIEVDVTDEDASETLVLMGVVLNEVFQIEAQTQSLRDRVVERKGLSTS